MRSVVQLVWLTALLHLKNTAAASRPILTLQVELDWLPVK